MVTKGYGLSVDDIDWSCPADLEPYAKAHMEEIKEQDILMWKWAGAYGLSSMFTAIEHNLFGRKAKSKYIDKPIFQQEESKELSEEELQKQRELFVAKLLVMQTNFEVNHPKK